MAATQVDNANTTNVIINSTSKSGGMDAKATNPPPLTFFNISYKKFDINRGRNVIAQDNYYKSGWYSLNVDNTNLPKTSRDTLTSETIYQQTTNLLNELLKFVYNNFYNKTTKKWDLSKLDTYKFAIAFKAQESAIPNTNNEKFGPDANANVSSIGALSKLRNKYMKIFIDEFIKKNTENSSTSQASFRFPKEFKNKYTFSYKQYRPETPYTGRNKLLYDLYITDTSTIPPTTPTPESKAIFIKFQSEQRTQLIIGILPPPITVNQIKRLTTTRSQNPASSVSPQWFNEKFGYGPDINLSIHLNNTSINSLPPNLLTRNKWFCVTDFKTTGPLLDNYGGVNLYDIVPENLGENFYKEVSIVFLIKPIGPIVERWVDEKDEYLTNSYGGKDRVLSSYNDAINPDSKRLIFSDLSAGSVEGLIRGANAYLSNEVIYAKKYTIEFYLFYTIGNYGGQRINLPIPNNVPESKGLWAMAKWYMNFDDGSESAHSSRKDKKYTDNPWETFIELPDGAPPKDEIIMFGKITSSGRYNDELFNQVVTN